jgi:hypothetical protein
VLIGHLGIQAAAVCRQDVKQWSSREQPETTLSNQTHNRYTGSAFSSSGRNCKKSASFEGVGPSQLQPQGSGTYRVAGEGGQLHANGVEVVVLEGQATNLGGAHRLEYVERGAL